MSRSLEDEEARFAETVRLDVRNLQKNGSELHSYWKQTRTSVLRELLAHFAELLLERSAARFWEYLRML